MVPDSSKRVHWRTSVQKGQKNPVFNQKFSFEILAEDATKRLVFSVWHRRSELVGCMSFSIRHVLDGTHKINGWYRLLREGFGTQKHFAAHVRKNPCIVKKK
ncbi:regulator of G-protein signaling 3 [Trichonephila clavata]|uniref:Regulator of G-protein signaling 3 n=1 Tax=Trichonephila clavata TaxID=2740835 RepID=A0A8X6HG81_TRICU|nr:regulator of G-protein signaling 3 [Trichonephila clavata]